MATPASRQLLQASSGCSDPCALRVAQLPVVLNPWSRRPWTARRVRGGDHAVGGEAELLVQDLVRRAGAEVVERRGTRRASPTKSRQPMRDAGLDRDAGPDLGRQHLPAGRTPPAPRTTRGTASTRPASGCPRASSRSRAASAICTSEPVAMRMHLAACRCRPRRARRRPWRRPRPTPSAARSSTGRFCRVRHRAVGPVGVLERVPPGDRGLVGVGGPHDVEAGDRAQRGQVLDRLVGRAVLAEADRVVGPDVDDRQLHQRREPHRAAHVVAEDEERAAEHPRAAVQRDAVHDRAHGVLADAEVQDPAVRRRRRAASGRNELGAFDRRCCCSRRGRRTRPTARAAPARSR